MAPIPLTLRERAENKLLVLLGVLLWLAVAYWPLWAFLAVAFFLLA